MTASFLDRVGAAPISWGICEAPGWGLQLPVDRVLAEAQALGITAFEQGAIGWLPVDPAEQRAKLDEYGMRLLGGFVPVVLHDSAQSSTSLADVDRIAAGLAAAGADYFVTAPVPSRDDWPRPDLSASEWDELLGNLDRITEIVGAHGLRQAVHPHVDTDIEIAADFARLLSGCGAELCFDTGHLTIGGVDVVAVAREHVDRIAVVHLKDVDATAMARERSGELDLMGATIAGLFPSIGDGIVPIDQVLDALAPNYDGWYVMETDVAIMSDVPADGEGPVRGVERSLSYLRSIDLASVGS